MSSSFSSARICIANLAKTITHTTTPIDKRALIDARRLMTQEQRCAFKWFMDAAFMCGNCHGELDTEKDFTLVEFDEDDRFPELRCDDCLKYCAECKVKYHTEAKIEMGDHTYCSMDNDQLALTQSILEHKQREIAEALELIAENKERYKHTKVSSSTSSSTSSSSKSTK